MDESPHDAPGQVPASPQTQCSTRQAVGIVASFAALSALMLFTFNRKIENRKKAEFLAGYVSALEGQNGEDETMTLEERLLAFSLAEAKLRMLTLDHTDDETDDPGIVATIDEINRHGRAIAAFTNGLGGVNVREAAQQEFETAAEAIRSAIPELKDQIPKDHAKLRAEQMVRRAAADEETAQK